MQVNVLGTMYTIQESNKVDDPALEECDGYCDDTVKLCVIDSMNCSDAMAKQNMSEYKKKVIRHELVHAFLFECGLAENSWANNEEIVDWIANMFPKMKVAFEKAESMVTEQIQIPQGYEFADPNNLINDLNNFKAVKLRLKGGE